MKVADNAGTQGPDFQGWIQKVGDNKGGSFEFRVGYAACGLIRVKSSFPAMRKSTVRMVANRV